MSTKNTYVMRDVKDWRRVPNPDPSLSFMRSLIIKVLAFLNQKLEV